MASWDNDTYFTGALWGLEIISVKCIACNRYSICGSYYYNSNIDDR